TYSADDRLSLLVSPGMDSSVHQLCRAQNVFGYADSSWGEDLSTRRSQSGYVFIHANAAISWNSKLQTTVALSSTEAEYLSLSAATKEALYLRGIFADLGVR